MNVFFAGYFVTLPGCPTALMGLHRPVFQPLAVNVGRHRYGSPSLLYSYVRKPFLTTKGEAKSGKKIATNLTFFMFNSAFHTTENSDGEVVFEIWESSKNSVRNEGILSF